MKISSAVKGSAKYRATGSVEKCDGKPAQLVTLVGSTSAKRAVSAAAVEVRTSSRQARSAAKASAKRKVRAKAPKQVGRSLEQLARAAAKRELAGRVGSGSSTNPGPMDPAALGAFRAELFELVNAARAENKAVYGGVEYQPGPVKYLPQLDPAAQAWADHLATLDFADFGHDPNRQAQINALGCNPPGAPVYGLPTSQRNLSENIFGASESVIGDSLARTAVEYWLASPTHRATMLNANTVWMGVGVTSRKRTVMDGNGDPLTYTQWIVVWRGTNADCSNLAAS